MGRCARRVWRGIARFNGNCEQAFDFYANVFGSTPTFDRFGATPHAGDMPASEHNKIMHASLNIGQNSVLMGSDIPAGMQPTDIGDNFSLSLQPTSEDEAVQLFDALSAGGQVTMPLEKTFWNATFGMFTDKFGINWMVNYTHN